MPNMDEWFRDDLFWIHTYPFMFGEDKWDAGDEQVEKVLALTGVSSGSVLDLCCGPGRHSLSLAKRGFHVTGVDGSPFLLEKSRERAGAEGVEVEWIQEDMRDFVRPDSYDLVLNMFTSFGYFENRGDDSKVLENIRRSLKPDATCVLEMLGKECLAGIFEPASCERLPDGSVLVQQREVVDDWAAVVNEWIVIKDGRARHFTFKLNLYSGQELKDRLEKAGFDNIRLFGGLDGSNYSVEAMRLVAVAN